MALLVVAIPESPEHYYVVDGNLRLTAGRSLGEACPPFKVEVIQASEADQLLMMAASGVTFPKDPISQGRHYKRLIKEEGFTQGSIAEHTGLSTATIGKCLAALELDEEIQELFIQKQLPSDIRIIRGLKNIPDQETRLRIARYYAGRFAGKEAVGKALGTGLADDVTVLVGKNESGKNESGRGESPRAEGGDQQDSPQGEGRGRNRNRNQQGQNTNQRGENQRGENQRGENQRGENQQGKNQQGGGQNGPRDDDEDGGGRGRRGRRFRERRRGRDRDSSTAGEPQISEDDVLQPVAGILDVLDNYAFVRTSGYLAGQNDVYVSMNLVRRYGLRRGDAVTGAVKVLKDGEQPNQRQKKWDRCNSMCSPVSSVSYMTIFGDKLLSAAA